MPSSSIPDTVSSGKVGQGGKQPPLSEVLGARDLKPVDLAVDVRASFQAGVEPFLTWARASSLATPPPLYQKSSATNPSAIPALLTSPFAVHALLMVIPGGAVVTRTRLAIAACRRSPASDIGQLEGTLTTDRSPPRPKALQLPVWPAFMLPSVTQIAPASSAGVPMCASTATPRSIPSRQTACPECPCYPSAPTCKCPSR